ncbi:DUF1385 domain-containing protein [archaeon]|jgi:uncharacterized protein YqhQ|nr:DUF1385 domain-containing protein [archaeon]MBT6762122.1 DUF1385 domain-containing protein [archaeon]
MNIGGQAVIEGVMMRNKEHYAVAVRLPDDSLKIKTEKSKQFPKFFKWPLVRGALGLWFTMYDGIRAMLWSSNQQLEDDEQITFKEAVLTMALSFGLAIGLFVALPFFLSKLIVSTETILFDIVDGIFRFAFFLGYLMLISKMKDVQTLFQYHGAEHKTIACFEAEEDLTVENVRKYSRFHPRCGTSFLMFIAILSVLIFMLIPGGTLTKFFGRIVLLPLVSALGFELIKLSGKFEKNFFVKMIITPGLWLQRITTKEPSDKQMEVGIASLKAVLK